MLVYSNRFSLDGVASLDDVAAVVAAWLSRSSRERVPVNALLGSGHAFRDGGRLECLWANDRFPILGSLKYTHRDASVSGRQWDTEIGVRRESESSPVECTVLLQVHDISPLVRELPSVTRPLVVRDLLSAFTPSPDTAGVYVESVDEHSAGVFADRLFSPGRSRAIVLVSPTAEGSYLVDVPRLQSLVIGLADIYLVPPDADTFSIQDAVGPKYAAYRGAINLIHPPYRRDEFIPSRRFLADELAEMKDSGDSPESLLLGQIAHRMNLPLSWMHISRHVVEREITRRQLDGMRSAASSAGELSAYEELLEQELERLSQQVAEKELEVESLNTDVGFWESQYQALEEEARQVRFDKQQLEFSLAAAAVSQGPVGAESLREPIRRVMSREVSVEDALALVSMLFPERVLVLPSAWKSASESGGFRHPEKALELLWKLATGYWEKLADGSGDTAARAVFGKAFAATESEGTSKNPGGLNRRTFTRNGQPILMLKHLKIGVGDSAAEGWRCHFEWDASEKLLIVGYCGRHLDFD